MEAKYQKLKRRVLVETAAIAVVLAVLGVMIFLLEGFGEDYVSGNANLKQQVDALDQDTAKLRAKFANIVQHAWLYADVQKRQDEGRLALNRQAGLARFNQFKDKYALNGLHLNASPTQEMKDPAFKRKNASVSFSDVGLTFDAMTDESVYAFLEALRSELPGLCKIVKINMTLQQPFSDDVLRAISQKGTYPLIKTELRLLWFGIHVAQPDAATSPAAVAPPVGGR